MSAPFVAAFDRAELLEVGARGVVELDLELVRFDLVERMRRVDRSRCRAWAAMSVRPGCAVRQREVLVDLLGRQHRDVAIDAGLLVVAPATAFVEREAGVDEVPVILDEIAHAVERVRRFLAAGQRELDACASAE